MRAAAASRGDVETPLVRSPGIVSTELDGSRTALLDLETQQYYSVNETGARIWSLLADGASPAEIARALERDYELADGSLAAVREFLDEMEREGLVRRSGPDPVAGVFEPDPGSPRAVRWFLRFNRACYRWQRRRGGGPVPGERLLQAVRLAWGGALLGLLAREDVHRIDEAFYDSDRDYRDDGYNLGGLFDWELAALEEHFAGCSSLWVAGAGGGREVLALKRMGYEARGFECHAGLREFANELLEREGFAADVELADRDRCPPGEGLHDGLIVGWGAYSLIQGGGRRIAFLRQLRARAHRGAPLLVSFFARDPGERRFKAVAAIGNLAARISGRPLVELGDLLQHNYLHYFTPAEIEAEMREAGFELERFSTGGYAHAVGVAR